MTYSLLLRYELLYSDHSSVRLEKVLFDGSTISGGLKAQNKIPAGSPILATASSMSTDIISEAQQGVSLIEAQSGQKGPLGCRLLLGPIRFANHDCNPNCQVSALI
jgi:hypothetical protein